MREGTHLVHRGGQKGKQPKNEGHKTLQEGDGGATMTLKVKQERGCHWKGLERGVGVIKGRKKKISCRTEDH